MVLGLSEVLLRSVGLALGRLLITGLLSVRWLVLGLWLVPGPLAGGLGSGGRRPGLYLDRLVESSLGDLCFCLLTGVCGKQGL